MHLCVGYVLRSKTLTVEDGLHGYQQNAPFVPSILVEFRKRLTEEVLNEINEMIIDFNKPDDPDGNVGGGDIVTETILRIDSYMVFDYSVRHLADQRKTA